MIDHPDDIWVWLDPEPPYIEPIYHLRKAEKQHSNRPNYTTYVSIEKFDLEVELYGPRIIWITTNNFHEETIKIPWFPTLKACEEYRLEMLKEMLKLIENALSITPKVIN